MNQAINPFFDLDESTEVRQFSYSALDERPDAVAFGDRSPWISFELLDTERNTTLVRFDVEDNSFHLVADFDDFRRMLHAPAPSHFRDVNQSFDARLKFDESAIVGDAYDSSDHTATWRVVRLNVQPRIGAHLF